MVSSAEGSSGVSVVATISGLTASLRLPIGLDIGDGPAEPEPDPADLRHSDLGPATVEPADPAGLSADDPEALVPAGLAPGRPPVGAAVEIAPGLVEIAPGLLLDGLAAGGQPGVLRSGLGQLPTLCGEVRGGLAAGGAVGVGLLQRQVPAEPGTARRPEQRRLLRRRRGQAEPGHPPSLSAGSDNPADRAFLPALNGGASSPGYR